MKTKAKTKTFETHVVNRKALGKESTRALYDIATGAAVQVSTSAVERRKLAATFKALLARIETDDSEQVATATSVAYHSGEIDAFQMAKVFQAMTKHAILKLKPARKSA